MIGLRFTALLELVVSLQRKNHTVLRGSPLEHSILKRRGGSYDPVSS